MEMNDVLRLQLLIRQANSHLRKLRWQYAPVQRDFLDRTSRHLRRCEHVLFQPGLPYRFRFALAKQRAISALQLLQLREQLFHFQDRMYGVQDTPRPMNILQAALQYVCPICAN